MNNSITFVIKYDPLKKTVHFSIRHANGQIDDIPEEEKIKLYENRAGLFSLEGHKEEILNYIKTNFYHEKSVDIEINVSQNGYEEYKVQFDSFEKYVNDFNNRNKQPYVEIIYKISPTENTLSDIADTQPLAKAVPIVNVAVIGKGGSGKTKLIRAICGCIESDTVSNNKKDGFSMNTDAKTGSKWYEIDGIEIEKYSVDRTNSILSRLVRENGVNVVLYCFRSRTGKIEDIERDFIVGLKRDYPHLKILAVVTECIDEGADVEFVKKISLSTKQTKVFNVLAEELCCKAGYLQPFGLEELMEEIHRNTE
jgi:hypothetical protein